MPKQNDDLIDRITHHNVEEIINLPSLTKRLAAGKKLRIKHGVDPTKPDLHLGHAVVLWKLKEFQDLGHTVIFLIGDYTARIGDPSGRNTTRPVLSEEEIAQNAKTYLAQVGKILDINKCEIRRNGEWFAKLTFADIIKLLAQTTVAQVIERTDFQTRLQAGIDVGMHEIIYPIMQGYDSVQLKCDVEIGGADQKLNMLMGRDLQGKFGQPEQEVMIMPLLIGTDGIKKMSKSLGNYIGIADEPREQFGKIMSIPDSLIMDYWKLCTQSPDEVMATLERGKTNPMDSKLALALRIVELYHGNKAATEAMVNFTKTIRQGELPEDITTITIDLNPQSIIDLLIATKLVDSKSEAKRMVEQKGVKIDQQTITDPETTITPIPRMVIQIGKRKFIRLN